MSGLCAGAATERADQLFGGTREHKYCEKIDRDAEIVREKLRELKGQLQTNAERRFDRARERKKPRLLGIIGLAVVAAALAVLYVISLIQARH